MSAVEKSGQLGIDEIVVDLAAGGPGQHGRGEVDTGQISHMMAHPWAGSFEWLIRIGSLRQLR
jgi:hypothetical protein